MQSFPLKTTPVVWLGVALCAFELLLRLPYLVWVQSTGFTRHSTLFYHFSVFVPGDVTRDGTLIVFLTLLAFVSAGRICNIRAIPRKLRARIVGLGPSIYVAGLIVLIAALFALRQLDAARALESISAKRDLSDLDSGLRLYLLLKLSLFGHVIATLSYFAFLGSGRRKHLFVAVFFGVITAIISIVFSQRAMLFVSAFEIIYATFLFRELNIRKIVIFSLPFFGLLLIIGTLREIGSNSIPLGDALILTADKLMATRYFMNIAKVGAVFHWQLVHGQVDFLSFSFITELIMPESVVSFKEIGPIISRSVFGVATSSVTLGHISETILSFGILIGIPLIFGSFLLIIGAERLIVDRVRFSVIVFFAIAKVPVLLNSSLGSYVYQTLIETMLMLPILSGLRWSISTTTLGARSQVRRRSMA